MKTVARSTAWVGFWLMLVVALALGAFLVWGLPALIPEGTQVLIDGRPIDLRSAHAGHWLLAALAVLVVAAVIVFVVPLLIVLAVGVPLAMSALGMAVALLMLTLAVTPLVLLVWWLYKQADAKRSTIPPS